MAGTRALTILGVAAVLGLAGCSGEQAADNAQNLTELNETQTLSEPEPVQNEAASTKVTPPPEAPIDPDAQMLDDAAATGMTARQPVEQADATNEAAPAAN